MFDVTWLSLARGVLALSHQDMSAGTSSSSTAAADHLSFFDSQLVKEKRRMPPAPVELKLPRSVSPGQSMIESAAAAVTSSVHLGRIIIHFFFSFTLIIFFLPTSARNDHFDGVALALLFDHSWVRR